MPTRQVVVFLALALLLLGVILELVRLVGAVVPTSTLFFLCILYLALLCLHYSIRISHLTHRVKDLAQEVALLRSHLEGPGD